MIRILGLALLLALVPTTSAGQDVELLGRRYGTEVPPEYRQLRAQQPDAFRFQRGRALRLRDRALDEPGEEGLPLGMARTSLGPRDEAVEGVFHVPVLLGLFGDSPANGPFPAGTFQEAYFDGGAGTISAYYEEVSRGLLDLTGDVRGWLRAGPTHTQAWVTNGNSGLGFGGRVGVYIKDLLDDAGDIDWSLYDNDGPDGIPDSGDDDGFVDALAVIHPSEGGECGGPLSDDRIWSHRWSLSSATGSSYTTSTPAAGGGFIEVDDYLVQPAYSCGSGLNEIGVFTHELGHAFGLPDLYDTVDQGGRHQGAGTWDLMATGSWGCDDRSPDQPCHMGAWSKLMLGWVDPVDIPAGSDLTRVTLPPVASTGTVYRVFSADGSGEYFLLENRRRTGFDASLHQEGLLVWQIDPDWVSGSWRLNEVNAYDHRGVWLRQADGMDHLGRSGQGRGDAGDPYPLVTPERENRVFHASSSPASRSLQGTGTGVTLLDIRRVGQDVSFDLLSRRYSVTVRTEGENGPQGVFSVDGASIPGSSHSFLSAPFDRHEVEAAAGELLEPGVRRPFREWVDAPAAPRVRTLKTPMEDVTLVARYQGEEVEVAMDVRGGVDGVEPAEFVSVPWSEDLWFPRGTEVRLEARPRTGFRFLAWSGALAGEPNPAVLVVEEPVEAGADFEVVYAAVPLTASLEAATERSVRLEVENGTDPVTWRIVEGTVPRGMRLVPSGSLQGAALEAGTFVLSMEAEDALGLRARARITLEVSEPVLGVDALAAPLLLGGPELTNLQARYLDLHGNADGAYDLGDFRAWVLTHPGLPMTAPVRALVAEPLVLTVPSDRGGNP